MLRYNAWPLGPFPFFLMLWCFFIAGDSRAEETLSLTFSAPPGTFFSADQPEAQSTPFTVKIVGADTWMYYDCDWFFEKNGLLWDTVTDTAPITLSGSVGQPAFTWSEDGPTAERPDQPLLTYSGHRKIDADITEYSNSIDDPSPHGDDTGRTATASKDVYVYPFSLKATDSTDTSNSVTDDQDTNSNPELFLPEEADLQLCLEGSSVTPAEKGRTKYEVVRKGTPAWTSGVASMNPSPTITLDVTDTLRTFDVYVWKDNDEGDDRDSGEQLRQVEVVVSGGPQFKVYAAGVAGPDKPHALDLNTKQGEAAAYAPYEKCVCHIWSSSALDMASYLYGYDDPVKRAQLQDGTVVTWRVDGTATTDNELDLGNEPDPGTFRRIDIEVFNAGDPSPSDRLILTLVPQSTLTNFNNWFTNELSDDGWQDQLPAPFQNVTIAGGVPQDPEAGDPNQWLAPTTYDSFYHPGAYFEMRSEATAGGHGHQAMYSQGGATASIITRGVSAGSADRYAPIGPLGVIGHLNADVIPFIWAAHLDGNPVAISEDTLTRPLLHDGVYLRNYLAVRPILPDGP